MSEEQSDRPVPLDLGVWTDAGSRLVWRGIANGDADQVRRALELFESVLAAVCPGDPNYAMAAANTANALIIEFELTGRAEALDRAISLLDAVEPDSAGFGAREADFFSILGHALLRDAERSGLAATAARAVAARSRALELTSTTDDAYPGRLSDLGAVLATQFRISGDLAALRQAVQAHEDGIRDSPAGDASLPGRLSNLGTCLDDLAMRTGDTAMLGRAVEVQRQAVGAVCPSDPLAAMVIANLASSLEHLYEETGSRATLDEAIGFHRQAVRQTSEEHVEYYPRQTNLAAALLSLYESSGQMKVLDEAIDIFRLAVSRTPAGHANRFRYLNNLAAALVRLAERTGEVSGADEALGMWREIVEATPDGHPAKPGRLSALGMATFLRFLRAPSDAAHLDSAIKALREALALTPDGDTQQAMLLSNLGSLLDSRFEYVGDQVSLEEALSVHRRAVELTPPDHTNRGPHLSNLGIAFLHKARISDSEADADQAIAVLSEALAVTDPSHPGRALTLYAFGAAHARAFELGQAEALTSGLAALRDAKGMDSASAVVRIRAGRDLGRLAASGRVLNDALDGFGTAVRLMEEAAWAGLRRADQQLLLTELHGLPMDAAAMAIEAGRLDEAIQLLELGRGVLLARRVEAPGLHAQLQSRAPDLAEQLARVQNALDELADDVTGVDSEPSSVTHPPGAAERRSRLARQRAEVLDLVRSQAGLENLARPPRLERLAAAGVHGPVVIVNVSQYRCDALTISDQQLRLVPLPDMTAHAVAEQVQNLLERTDAASHRAVEDVLQWTRDPARS